MNLSDYHIVSAQSLDLVKIDLYTAKTLSEGFEPTPRETDFDSVVITTCLTPVRWTSWKTIH
jgi:hypothetical protein